MKSPTVDAMRATFSSYKYGANGLFAGRAGVMASVPRVSGMERDADLRVNAWSVSVIENI